MQGLADPITIPPPVLSDLLVDEGRISPRIIQQGPRRDKRFLSGFAVVRRDNPRFSRVNSDSFTPSRFPKEISKTSNIRPQCWLESIDIFFIRGYFVSPFWMEKLSDGDQLAAVGTAIFWRKLWNRDRLEMLNLWCEQVWRKSGAERKLCDLVPVSSSCWEGGGSRVILNQEEGIPSEEGELAGIPTSRNC